MAVAISSLLCFPNVVEMWLALIIQSLQRVRCLVVERYVDVYMFYIAFVLRRTCFHAPFDLLIVGSIVFIHWFRVIFGARYCPETAESLIGRELERF